LGDVSHFNHRSDVARHLEHPKCVLERQLGHR
jgi:hypothetical protein